MRQERLDTRPADRLDTWTGEADLLDTSASDSLDISIGKADILWQPTPRGYLDRGSGHTGYWESGRLHIRRGAAGYRVMGSIQLDTVAADRLHGYCDRGSAPARY